MPKHFKLLAAVLLAISMMTTVIGYAANTDSSKLKAKGGQNELSEIQQDGRKKLKQKLKLSYTHPDFEKMLDNNQKEAIINSLKKWKLDLPTNNTFTVTSIGNLKDPNNKVIYMWSSTPNPNWDQSKTPTAEDSETGDPRFIRTEFNVLLNKAPKKAWKATIEQDNDLKTELNNIPESEISTDEKNVLFGKDKADNLFTAKSELLIDINATTSTSSSFTTSSSFVSSTSSATVSSSSIIATSTNSSVSSTKSEDKKVGLLDLLFTAPKVSAGPSDYSWPWANGITRNVNLYTAPTTKWHTDQYDSTEGLDTGDRAIDIQFQGGTDILAPITGVAYRRCSDANNSTFVIRSAFTPNNTYGGNGMRLLHLTPDTNVAQTSYTKGQKIGTVQTGLLPWNSSFGCGGGGYGDHIHLKFLANNMVVDGTTITYGNNYNSFTSQNGTTTTPPTVPATNPKFVIRRTLTNQCVNSFQPYNGKPLDTWTCDTTDPEETWEQVPLVGGFSLKRKNTNYCFDAANPGTNDFVKNYTCNGTDSQKFLYDSNSNSGTYKALYRAGTSNNGQCVAKGSPGNGLTIKMYTCSAFNGNFQWDLVPV